MFVIKDVQSQSSNSAITAGRISCKQNVANKDLLVSVSYFCMSVTWFSLILFDTYFIIMH